MDVPDPVAEAADLSAIADLADRLQAFAADLSARERQLLMSIITQAMDPLTRVQASARADLLTSDEEALLRDLAEKPLPG